MGGYLIKCKKHFVALGPSIFSELMEMMQNLVEEEPGISYTRRLLQMRYVNVGKAGDVLGGRSRFGYYFKNMYSLIIPILKYLAADDEGADWMLGYLKERSYHDYGWGQEES